MENSVDIIVEAAREYGDDWDYWKGLFEEGLDVEGMGETYCQTLYGGVRELLEGKLRRKIIKALENN